MFDKIATLVVFDIYPRVQKCDDRTVSMATPSRRQSRRLGNVDDDRIMELCECHLGVAFELSICVLMNIYPGEKPQGQEASAHLRPSG